MLSYDKYLYGTTTKLNIHQFINLLNYFKQKPKTINKILYALTLTQIASGDTCSFHFDTSLLMRTVSLHAERELVDLEVTVWVAGSLPLHHNNRGVAVHQLQLQTLRGTGY